MRKCLIVIALACLPLNAQTKAQCAKLVSCPNDGCGSRRDPALNLQKNRTGEPTTYRPFTFKEFVALNDEAVNRKTRSTWNTAERSRVSKVEDGPGVTVVAYLFDATLSDPETCNCFKSKPENRDFHIWLAADAGGAAKKQFVVVEMTPLSRRAHPGWTLPKITKIKPHKGKPWTLVRVKGYPLFDSEHWNFPQRKIRATAWEVHPVTEFSFCPAGKVCAADSDGEWVRLEDR